MYLAPALSFWDLVAQVEVFKEFATLMAHSCAISHSGAGAERTFSVLALFKAKPRNGLSNQGLAKLMRAKKFVRDGGRAASNVVINRDVTSCKCWKRLSGKEHN